MIQSVDTMTSPSSHMKLAIAGSMMDLVSAAQSSLFTAPLPCLLAGALRCHLRRFELFCVEAATCSPSCTFCRELERWCWVTQRETAAETSQRGCHTCTSWDLCGHSAPSSLIED